MIKEYKNKKVEFTFFFNEFGKSLKELLEESFKEEEQEKKGDTSNVDE